MTRFTQSLALALGVLLCAAPLARADGNDRVKIDRGLQESLRLGAATQPVIISVSTNLAQNVSSFGLTEGGINLQIQDATLEEAIAALETRMISDSLKRHANNITKVAKELGITRRGIYLKLERYNLK